MPKNDEWKHWEERGEFWSRAHAWRAGGEGSAHRSGPRASEHPRGNVPVVLRQLFRLRSSVGDPGHFLWLMDPTPFFSDFKASIFFLHIWYNLPAGTLSTGLNNLILQAVRSPPSWGEGAGSGSIPLNNGFGSGRIKNIRIRLPDTASKVTVGQILFAERSRNFTIKFFWLFSSLKSVLWTGIVLMLIWIRLYIFMLIPILILPKFYPFLENQNFFFAAMPFDIFIQFTKTI